MSLLWSKVAMHEQAGDEHEPGEGCPGGLDHFDYHRCDKHVTHIWHQGYGVMALHFPKDPSNPHSRASTMLTASHRPNSYDGEGPSESIGEGRIDEGVIDNVGISTAHQRKGVSKLWGAAVHHLQARGEHPDVVASHERTEKGDAAMRGLGITPEDKARKVVYKGEHA